MRLRIFTLPEMWKGGPSREEMERELRRVVEVVEEEIRKKAEEMMFRTRRPRVIVNPREPTWPETMARVRPVRTLFVTPGTRIDFEVDVWNVKEVKGVDLVYVYISHSPFSPSYMLNLWTERGYLAPSERGERVHVEQEWGGRRWSVHYDPFFFSFIAEKEGEYVFTACADTDEGRICSEGWEGTFVVVATPEWKWIRRVWDLIECLSISLMTFMVPSSMIAMGLYGEGKREWAWITLALGGLLTALLTYQSWRGPEPPSFFVDLKCMPLEIHQCIPPPPPVVEAMKKGIIYTKFKPIP